MNNEPFSAYAVFWFSHLGFNFQNPGTKEVLNKGEYYERYGDTLQDAWGTIEYEPPGGWEHEYLELQHYKKVNFIKADFKQFLKKTKK